MVTDAGGVAIALGVPAGTMQASATLAGQGGSASGALLYDDQVLELAIQLSQSVSAHGVVYQPVPGDAVGGGTVLVPQVGALATLRDANNVAHVAVAGADGVYRLSALPVGPYALEVCDSTCEARVTSNGVLGGPHGTDHELPAVVLDAVPPTIVSITPPPGLEGVSRTAPVEIVFSELLDPAVLPVQGSSSLFSVGAPIGAAAGAWSATEVDGRQVVRFVPSQPYENLTWYGVTIIGGAQGVRDRAGRLLKQFGNVGSSFKTSDTIGPAVIGTEPTLARPVPPVGTVRVDFNEAVVIAAEGLDGDGVDDAGELFWGKDDGGGGIAWQPYPVVLQLTRSNYSLAVQPYTGINMTGDTGHRRLRVSRATDSQGNQMPVWEQTFRIYDSHPPVVAVGFPAGAPAGVLSAGTSYSLVPALSELDDVAPQNPGGDVDRVEYFLSEPMAGSAPTFTAVAFPFEFTFVAAYGGSGSEPTPLSVWVRATDTSSNRSNVARVDMQILPNQPPSVGAVTAESIAPMPGAAYPGSTVRVTVTGLTDPDGAALTLNVALVPAGGGEPIAAAPARTVARPASGSWSDLDPQAVELTVPLNTAEGTQIVARATAIDSKNATGSAASPSFTVADDQAPPTLEGLIARRPGHPASSPYFIGQTIVLELRVRDAETAVNAVSLSFSEHFPPQVATLVAGSSGLYRTPELTVPEVGGEVAITATAQATDHGGNAGTATTTFAISPTADPYAPTATWLTPWEGAAWPAAYTSVNPVQTGTWLWLRVRAGDLDLVGGQAAPGTIASVRIRGPVVGTSGIELAPSWTDARQSTEDGRADVWELEWLVPNAVATGTWLPFEVRVVDAGANVVTRAVRMQAVPYRKVYEGVESAVLPDDTMQAAGGCQLGRRVPARRHQAQPLSTQRRLAALAAGAPPLRRGRGDSRRPGAASDGLHGARGHLAPRDHPVLPVRAGGRRVGRHRRRREHRRVRPRPARQPTPRDRHHPRDDVGRQPRRRVPRWAGLVRLTRRLAAGRPVRAGIDLRQRARAALAGQRRDRMAGLARGWHRRRRDPPRGGRRGRPRGGEDHGERPARRADGLGRRRWRRRRDLDHGRPARGSRIRRSGRRCGPVPVRGRWRWRPTRCALSGARRRPRAAPGSQRSRRLQWRPDGRRSHASGCSWYRAPPATGPRYRAASRPGPARRGKPTWPAGRHHAAACSRRR
ncbi:MAG: Ig-like domain-containing protein [Thermoanaerobaculaceae bacterium]